jgi:hypothetical protein
VELEPLEGVKSEENLEVVDAIESRLDILVEKSRVERVRRRRRRRKRVELWDISFLSRFALSIENFSLCVCVCAAMKREVTEKSYLQRE